MGLPKWSEEIFRTDAAPKPPKPLVLGAVLRCWYGSEPSFLIVDGEGMTANQLPVACVTDSKPILNILSFGNTC